MKLPDSTSATRRSDGAVLNFPQCQESTRRCMIDVWTEVIASQGVAEGGSVIH